MKGRATDPIEQPEPIVVRETANERIWRHARRERWAVVLQDAQWVLVSTPEERGSRTFLEHQDALEKRHAARLAVRQATDQIALCDAVDVAAAAAAGSPSPCSA